MARLRSYGTGRIDPSGLSAISSDVSKRKLTGDCPGSMNKKREQRQSCRKRGRIPHQR